MVSLKCQSNFWGTLKMLLSILAVGTIAYQITKFEITGTNSMFLW